MCGESEILAEEVALSLVSEEEEFSVMDSNDRSPLVKADDASAWSVWSLEGRCSASEPRSGP